ncbi:hypothetical protein EK904_003191, partial [Melospiza melodia maxima]
LCSSRIAGAEAERGRLSNSCIGPLLCLCQSPCSGTATRRQALGLSLFGPSEVPARVADVKHQLIQVPAGKMKHTLVAVLFLMQGASALAETTAATGVVLVRSHYG